MTNVDIVVPYVDNSKEKWQKEFIENKFREHNSNDQESGAVRFRNWDDFKFFIRSVNKYCNWFRHLVIILEDEDQVPSWLDTSNERLKIVYHRDYIPKELLPTYNSNVIECFIPLIDDISDSYVLCNDDTFFFDYVPEDFFVKDNLPVLEDFKVNYALYEESDLFTITLNNNLRLEKKLHPELKDRWSSPHFQVAHNKINDKKILLENWNTIVNSFSASKFRSALNYTHHMYNDLARIENKCILSKNMYVYTNAHWFLLTSYANFRSIPKIKMCCINDAFIGDNQYFLYTKDIYLKYLDFWLPERSEFEKW